jgi:arylsulfatase A-like enzyme/Flp pilus assembly protein TadD
VLLVLASFACTHRETAPAKTYNLLLITLDTTRADHLGAYGFRSAETPALDALAASGIRFANAGSPVPLTLPAHAAILSGLLPIHHGIRDNGGASFPAGRETLPKLLQHAGYRTAAFVGSFVLDHRFGLGGGFDVYDDEIRRDPNQRSTFDAERSGGEVTDRALAWLDREDARPFFAWVHLYDAHAPYEPPEPFRSRHAGSLYDGELAYVDAQVGRIVDDLRKRGQLKRTIIAIVGDHGESLGEHGELTHGLLLYEPTLHVPLIVSAPGLLAAAVIEQPISSVDLAPTLGKLLGVTFAANAKLDGHDLSASLLANSEPMPADLFAETEYPAIFGWSDLATLRRGHLKLIASPKPELYDLAADPRETRNLLSDERRTYRDLSTSLELLRAGAAPAATAPAVDAETRAKLASLGYVAPTAAANGNGARPDPLDMAPLFHAFEEANWASNAGHPDEAIARLKPIVAADPANAVFRGSLARALRSAGRLTEAIPLYRQATAMAPHDPETWYNLAVALQEAGETREAGVAIREAIRRDDQRPEAHNALGIAYSAEGKANEARAEFEKAIAIDPLDARAFNNLGNTYRDVGQFDQAATAYSHAMTLAPGYADPLNGLGVIEVQRDHPAAAVPLFDRALQAAPRFYEAQLNRGIALQLAGRNPEAADQFRVLLRDLPRGKEHESQRRAATELLRRLSASGK